MIIVNSREFRENQKKYFDLAEIQRVIIKRKDKFMELVSHGKTIPEGISPSNDSYFDNPRNIEDIEKGLKQDKEGKIVKLTPSLRDELFGDL